MGSAGSSCGLGLWPRDAREAAGLDQVLSAGRPASPGRRHCPVTSCGHRARLHPRDDRRDGSLFSGSSRTRRLLEELSPGHGYHDGKGRCGVMLAQLENRCACCDHVIPVSRGSNPSIENSVAACSACNREKSDGPVPENRAGDAASRPPEWDGFVSLYPRLPRATAGWCRAIEDRESWVSV